MPPPDLGSPSLILVPTQLELARLEGLGGLGRGVGQVHLCGFGPVSAAARTAALLERLTPRRVILVGIAGTYDPSLLPVGSAATFAEVLQEDVGAHDGSGGLQLPSALGLPQWQDAGRRIHERLELAPPDSGERPRGLLISVAAASGSHEEALGRARRHPGALAEDMEAFSVALACALRDVPLHVVRGISNVAGDRDHGSWRIEEALEAARLLVLERLA